MEAPLEFNEGLRKASAEGKLDDNPKFKAAVDAAPIKMISTAMPGVDPITGMIQQDQAIYTTSFLIPRLNLRRILMLLMFF